MLLLMCFLVALVRMVSLKFNVLLTKGSLNWPFYYTLQIQGQMEIVDREWVDLYCWTPNGSSIFRVCQERGYWDLIHGILHEFWWGNVNPAREPLLVGGEDRRSS